MTFVERFNAERARLFEIPGAAICGFLGVIFIVN
jgi:hypothetical protein